MIARLRKLVTLKKWYGKRYPTKRRKMGWGRSFQDPNDFVKWERAQRIMTSLAKRDRSLALRLGFRPKAVSDPMYIRGTVGKPSAKKIVKRLKVSKSIANAQVRGHLKKLYGPRLTQSLKKPRLPR